MNIESQPVQSRNQNTTVIVDISVLIHALEAKHKILKHQDPHWSALIKAQLLWLGSGDWLGDLKPSEFQMVFVSDNKANQKYWRHDYLLRADVVASVPRKKKPEEKKRLRLLELLSEPLDTLEYLEETTKLTEDLAIHYKAGRKFPSYEFSKLKKLTFETIRALNWQQFGQSGYEADDIAATFVKINETLANPNRLILLTIDSDWMGLVNDNTAWFCSHGWFPRVRSDSHSCNVWAEKRLKSTLENFRDIWDVKGRQGDKSDAIPASNGALLPIIDLLNPPAEFQLWNQPIAGVIKDALEFPKFRKVDPKAAIRYIEQLGVDLCVRPLDNLRDLAA